MCVDVSKIRKGDKVLVELTVDRTPTYCKDGFYSEVNGEIYIPHNLIKQHIPAPRPIEVGCKAIHKDLDKQSYSIIPTVIHIHHDTMWVCAGSHQELVHMPSYKRVD